MPKEMKKRRSFIDVAVDDTFESYKAKLNARGTSPSSSEYSNLEWLKNLDKASNKADTEGLKALGKVGEGSTPMPKSSAENVRRRVAESERINKVAKAAYGKKE
jgi:hypothetical protein